MRLSFILSRTITILSGLILIAYAVYDIYDELFEPTHEHILMVMGVLLVISSFGHMNEGIYKIAHDVSPNRDFGFLQRVGRFFHRPVVRIILGLTILIAATYGFYEDYEKIHSKSVSVGVGVFTLILPISKGFMGGENLMKGINKRDD